MKKYIRYSAAAVSAIAISVMGVTAFAENAPVLVSEKPSVTETVKLEASYSILTGKITSIKVNEDGSATIEFKSAEKGDIVFNETATDCMVINGTSLSGFSSLKEGMEAKVIMNDNAPMTMSLPPQTNGAMAIVVNNDKSVEIDKFNDKLIGSKLEIKVGETTQIVDVRGTKQILKADDIKGHECLVVYGAATKSIPAQTTPDLVVILDNAEKTEVPEVVEPEKPVTPEEKTVEIKTVGLRETFEKMGYEIKWTANDKPITITNGKVTATVVVGQKTVTFDGDMVKEISAPVSIVDGVTFVTSDIVNLF